MNKNPLLIKSSLTGKIPFMKGRTLSLYNKFLSNNRFHKVLLSERPDNLITETLSAYRINSEYKTDFVFDGIDITPSTHFSEDEWIALGMLLRAYKEVEGVNLLHLYNCLYKTIGSSSEGNVIKGRTYSLYTSSLFPVTIEFEDEITKDKVTTVVPQIDSCNPYLFRIPTEGDNEESVIKIKITFNNSAYRPCTLVEGVYGGLLKPDTEIIKNWKGEEILGKTGKFTEGRKDLIVPEILDPGEYSDRLVEFFAGTLATKLSNPKVFSQSSQVAFSSPRFHNSDGFFGKEVQV